MRFQFARRFSGSMPVGVARRARAIRYPRPMEGKESMFNPIILMAFGAFIVYLVLENLRATNEAQSSHC